MQNSNKHTQNEWPGTPAMWVILLELHTKNGLRTEDPELLLEVYYWER